MVDNRLATIGVTPMYCDTYEDFDRKPLKEVIQKLEEILAKVPEEYRDVARIEFKASSRFYSVYYERPETDEEAEERRKIDAKKTEDAKRADLVLLAKLKEKYPDA